jgi:hypothetical protein
VFIGLAAFFAPVTADTNLSGDIGVDLQNYRFNSSQSDDGRNYASNRARSSHFLGLALEGPLVNSYFANYLVRGSFRGVYFDSRSETVRATEYVSPTLRTLNAQLLLLSSKPYPIRATYSRADEYTLRLELNNRSDVDRLRPELGVIRRYNSDRDALGVNWQIALRNNVSLMTEVRSEATKAARIYDFEEDQDIWTSSLPVGRRDRDSVYFFVEFQNGLSDSVTITVLNLDSLSQSGDPRLRLIEDLPPGDAFLLDSLVEGLHEVTIDSRTFNQLRARVDLDNGNFNRSSDLLVRIFSTPPAAPNDLDQKINAMSGILKVGNNGRFESKTFYEYTDLREAVQEQTTFLHNLTNDIRYELLPDLQLAAMTTLQGNKQTIADRSSQSSTMFQHQTTLGLSQSRGISALLSHSISAGKARIQQDTVTTKLNTLEARVSVPVKAIHYRLDVAGAAAFTNSQQRNAPEEGADPATVEQEPDYINDKYRTDFTGNFDFKWRGFKFAPSHQFKYSRTTQENPDLTTNEVETRFALMTTTPATALLGSAKLNGEIRYRNRYDTVGSDNQTKYSFDASVSRPLGDMFRLNFMTNQEYEVYGGDAPVSGREKQPQFRSSYKLSLQATVSARLSGSLDYMLITQSTKAYKRVDDRDVLVDEKTVIEKFGAALLLDIPKINLPIKSFLSAQIRDLGDLPNQTQFSIETKTNYQIRKIVLTLSHSYRREKQLFETYGYHEILGKISRQFSLL